MRVIHLGVPACICAHGCRTVFVIVALWLAISAEEFLPHGLPQCASVWLFPRRPVALELAVLHGGLMLQGTPLLLVW